MKEKNNENQIKGKHKTTMGINKKSIMFNVNKYNKIMNHIDEHDDKDIKITSLTDTDIFNKIRDGGYSYEFNNEVKVLEKLRKKQMKIDNKFLNLSSKSAMSYIKGFAKFLKDIYKRESRNKNERRKK